MPKKFPNCLPKDSLRKLPEQLSKKLTTNDCCKYFRWNLQRNCQKIPRKMFEEIAEGISKEISKDISKKKCGMNFWNTVERTSKRINEHYFKENACFKQISC